VNYAGFEIQRNGTRMNADERGREPGKEAASPLQQIGGVRILRCERPFRRGLLGI